MHPEPNYAEACHWWSDLEDIWTPVGWKDHLFAFNVFFNGAILAQPDLNRRTENWKGQGVQLSFYPCSDRASMVSPAYPDYTTHYYDDGMVKQGWEDAPAPVLYSEYVVGPAVLRQQVVAHVSGGKAVETGIEPLFAWVRLSVHDFCPGIPHEDRYGFLMRINAPHILSSMWRVYSLTYHLERAQYPRKLHAETMSGGQNPGFRLVEEDGKIRLGIPNTSEYQATYTPNSPLEFDSEVFLSLEAVKGAHVDVLVPMLPTDRETFDRELALGFEGALAETNAFWTPKPATAARMQVPEGPINEVIEQSLRFAEVIAEKNPADGQYAFRSGSFIYSDLWTTPHAMNCIMMLDTLGYHEIVERHLRIFKKEQGTVVPPGDAFILHPGYLSSPKSLTSIDWISDHGALLYTIASHALLSGDRQFTEEWAEAIVKACDFVKDARAIRGHGGRGRHPSRRRAERQSGHLASGVERRLGL